MKSFYILCLFILLTAEMATAQVGINTDGADPDPSAIIDVKSSTKGALLPRMTFNERNSIANPSDGLIVFCTNCGENGLGMLCIYTAGDWFTLNFCKIDPPTAGVHIANPFSITWIWNAVPGAVGYKWSKTNVLDSAIDIGTDLSKTESSLACATSYNRYVWAYNSCGISMTTLLTKSTSNCFSCGENFIISHIAGNVAPVTKTTTYGTVTNVPGEPTKCWTTSNLGSSHQATNYDDNTEASAGWYWQFDKKQGYKHDGTTRTPASTWISYYFEYSNWTAANDPCSVELGNGWRIPTKVEWENADGISGGNWGNWINTWNSLLKLHAAGRLNTADGAIANRGVWGTYWSSVQATEELAWRLNFNSGSCTMGNIDKPYGYTLRCIKD